jgi:hypothetical protein
MAIPPLSPLPGIAYSNRQFSEPTRFPPLLAPLYSGIYAILVSDLGFRPRPFRLLYLGESSFLGERLTRQHEKYNDWVREAGTTDLYFAYHPTIGMTDQQRKDLECALINQHCPPCNLKVKTLLAQLIRG